MGCPPAKVNTQTTHSCPSLKHAYTHMHSHKHTDAGMLVFSFHGPSSGIFLFSRMSYFLDFLSLFPNGRFTFSYFEFSWPYPCIFLKHTCASVYTFLLLTKRDLLWTRIPCFSLNLNIDWCRCVCISCIWTACHSSTTQSQPEPDVGHVGRMGCKVFVYAPLGPLWGLSALLKSTLVGPPFQLNNLAQDRLLVQRSTSPAPPRPPKQR